MTQTPKDTLTTLFDGVPDITIRFDRTFADLTTLRIGGTPAATIEATTPIAICDTVRILSENNIRWIVVGGGSNLVVGDYVSDLVVIHPVPTRVVDRLLPTQDKENPSVPWLASVWMDPATGIVSAFAGVTWDSLVAATVNAGLGGLECLSGIPGTVGAVPVQNVGAYGVEVSQVLTRVMLCYPPTGRWEWVSADSLDLSYRYSNLKFTGRAVVCAVEFQLFTDGLSAPLRYGELARRLGVPEPEQGSAAAEPVRLPASAVRDAVLELRRGKGMVLNPDDPDTYSAGSFFTNPIVSPQQAETVRAAVEELHGQQVAQSMPAFPVDGGVKLSAAWLIDRSGLAKGWAVRPGAPASLSTKHTLALTNRGTATSADILELAESVQAHVHSTFGVHLEPEPIYLGITPN